MISSIKGEIYFSLLYFLPLKLVNQCWNFDPNEMTNIFDDDNSSNLKKELMDMIEERPGKELSNFDEPVGMA